MAALDVGDGLLRLPESAAARGDVDAVWLFGSYGTERQTPLSDVDIAILPRLGTPPDVHWVLHCSAWLAEMLATDEVGAIRLDTAPLWLQAEIVDTGRLLFVRDAVRLADCVEHVWRMWGDFAIDWRAFQAEARRARQEASPVDIEADRLRGKLDHIVARVAQLRETRTGRRDAFLADRVLVDASVRRLQTAIEAAIAAALHVVVRENLGTPRDHGDAFRLLAQAGVLSEQALPRLLAMVRLRNLAVHLYADVDDDAVWAIVDRDLADFDGFVAALTTRYLQAGPSADTTK